MSLRQSAVRRAAEGPSSTTGSWFEATALAQRFPRSETLGLNRIGAALADLDRLQRLGGAIEPRLVLAGHRRGRISAGLCLSAQDGPGAVLAEAALHGGWESLELLARVLVGPVESRRLLVSAPRHRDCVDSRLSTPGEIWDRNCVRGPLSLHACAIRSLAGGNGVSEPAHTLRQGVRDRVSARPLHVSGLSREEPRPALQLAKDRRLGFNPPRRAHRAVARDERVEPFLRGFGIAVSGGEVAALISPLLRHASVVLDGGSYAIGIEPSAEAVAAARADIGRDQHFSPCRMVVFGARGRRRVLRPERLARIANLGPLPLRGRELVDGGVRDRGCLHLAPPHLARELTHVARRFGRDKHLGLLALAGERDVARGLPPMMRVQQISLVERLALAFVDRAGIAVTEADKLRCRPHHLAGLGAGRGVETRSDHARGRINRSDRAGIAVINPRRFQRVGELHAVADREIRRTVLRLEAVVALELTSLFSRHPELGIEAVDILVRVGEHETRFLRLLRRVVAPSSDKHFARFVLFGRPGDRLLASKRAQGVLEAPLCKIACRLPLPIDLLACNLSDRDGSVPLSQLGKEAAALDRGKLAVVAGKNHFRLGAFRLSEKLAHDAAVEHGRLVHDHDGATAPGGQPVLDPEQLGMDRAGAREAALAAQILRDRVRRGEPNHLMPAPLMRLADSGEREALSRAGAALDNLETALPPVCFKAASWSARSSRFSSASAFARALTRPVLAA